jgi:uroporphyrinogen decarboxylase
MVPADDNPHVRGADGQTIAVGFEDVDPDRLYYVDPHDLAGVTWPTAWGLQADAAVPGPAFFPPWHWDTIARVRAAAPDVSVHGEVFSPLSQLMELVGYTSVLGALLLDPGKVIACLERLTEGAAALACGHFAAGADAVLISSAFAGAGFLSPDHYRRFVLPFERTLVEKVAATMPGRPVYTHTCGAIGDRLELMEQTGTWGIDTLDPPPLGTVDLADAKRRLGTRLFIKGNIDPVNTVLRGTPEGCYQDARSRIAVAGPGGGYILSTACSVPPHASPDHILAISRAAEQSGSRHL